MPHDRLEKILTASTAAKRVAGTSKGQEQVISEVIPAQGGKGPRFLLADQGDKPFLRMNSNSYLGMSFRHELIRAEEVAARKFGTGPGAVRFISGTWSPHIDLEKRLAAFHGRTAAMIFSSAYATMMGLLPALISEQTVVISDELNHSCIINATALARPAEKRVYRHLDLDDLEAQLVDASANCRRAIIVTDGVFSMRGDHAPLDKIRRLAEKYDHTYSENILLVVDDSHGVGAFGATGLGTEEYCGDARADILVGTLGKAFGVNGGYLVASTAIVEYLRENSPFYIYSNPITAGEAAAAFKAVEILDSPQGEALLKQLRTMTARFQKGLVDLGLETIIGEHPVVPLMIRETERTAALVDHLLEYGVLATGLNYPVVPKGDEEIRFQMSADHTPDDIDEALDALRQFSL
ncbi:MAG: pyridoxal phosphate-dependent aminotransferase family protein [Gammaproteobacteria bacterium]|nr:MAG: pyridoxal phosphate-dependent aminotransferase family protein [Gammaproteobacteria bacterium]RLA50298.1 MAG: pyridoxal phosphate-dependent aminotransferase family protein [Gammaproteobacteria bacterium]